MESRQFSVRMNKDDWENVSILKKAYGFIGSQVYRHALRVNKDNFFTRDIEGLNTDDNTVRHPVVTLKGKALDALNEYVAREDVTAATAVREAVHCLAEKVRKEEKEIEVKKKSLSVKFRQFDMDNLEVVKKAYGFKNNEAFRHALIVNRKGSTPYEERGDFEFGGFVKWIKVYTYGESLSAMLEFMKREKVSASGSIRMALESLANKIAIEESSG